MELDGKRYAHTGASVPVSFGQGSVEGKGDEVDGMQESWLLQTRAHSGGGARASAHVYSHSGASFGVTGEGTSHRLDAHLRRHNGEKFANSSLIFKNFRY